MGIRKRTTKEFKRAILEKYNGKIEIVGEFKGSNEPVEFVYHCEKHGDTIATMIAKHVSSNKKFQPCRECTEENKNKSCKSGIELFDELGDIATSHGGFLLDREWVNYSHKYKFKCSNPEHPIFETTYLALKRNKQPWCPHCSGRVVNYNDEIDLIVKTKDGVLLTEYVNAHKHVRVKCNKDDYEWDITPLNLKKGKWCYVCYMPWSERVVYDLLIKTKFTVKPQYSFDDLAGENNQKMRFDFALIENGELKVLIEIDDAEHKRKSSGESERGMKRLRAKNRDIQKEKYCNQKNINLLRIQIGEYSGAAKDEEKYEKFIKEEITKHLGDIWQLSN